jgi:isovaleryl-CoA dehydrogenase
VDFHLTAEQIEIQQTVRKFAKNEIAPLAEEIDRNDKLPAELVNKIGEMGLLGLMIPEEYGGTGAGVVTSCVVGEEIARACASIAFVYGASGVLCAHNLARTGSEAQKKKYLPALASGEKLGALAMTEPDAGSDVLSMRTSAERRNGEYILNGTKTFITNGPVADVVLVYARTDKNAGPRGISAFIVENTFPGFSVGKEFKKMGMRGSPTSELIFEDCRVPAENLIGEENGGLRILMSGLDVERVVMSCLGVGIAQAAFDASVNYAKERVQFGQPLITFEMIGEMLANMSTEIEASRLLTLKAAALCDEGVRATVEASHAKLFSAEAAMRATTNAVQIHGGYGYMQEFGVERLMRDAKVLAIGGGTSQVQQLIIMRELMKD